MKFLEVSIKIKIAFVLATLAWLFIVIGFGTNSWASITEQQGQSVSYGLWTVCSDDLCGTYPDQVLDSQFKACRAFVTIGFVLSTLGVILLCLYLFVPPMADKSLLPKVATGFAFASGVFVVVGVILFATIEIVGSIMYGKYLSYSAILPLVGAVMNFVAGGLLVAGN